MNQISDHRAQSAGEIYPSKVDNIGATLLETGRRNRRNSRENSLVCAGVREAFCLPQWLKYYGVLLDDHYDYCGPAFQGISPPLNFDEIGKRRIHK